MKSQVAWELAEEFGPQFGLSADDVLDRRRTPSRVKARTLCFQAARERYQMSYPEIGEAFGKHHTTVMHLINPERRAAKNTTRKVRHGEL